MSTLYEIDRAIMNCCNQEPGEMIDQEALDALMMQRTEKLEAVALWIKNLQSDAIAFKAEKEAFAEREKAANAKAEQLKDYLARALDGKKFSTNRCAVSFRRSESVEVMDEGSVPKAYMVETVTYKPDKKLIKDLLKNGENVGGCRLVETLNAQIK